MAPSPFSSFHVLAVTIGTLYFITSRMFVQNDGDAGQSVLLGVQATVTRDRYLVPTPTIYSKQLRQAPRDSLWCGAHTSPVTTQWILVDAFFSQTIHHKNVSSLSRRRSASWSKKQERLDLCFATIRVGLQLRQAATDPFHDDWERCVRGKRTTNDAFKYLRDNTEPNLILHTYCY